MLTLVQDARNSSCLLAPSRPPQAEALPGAIAIAAAQGEPAAMYRVAETYMAEPASSHVARQTLLWLERAALDVQIDHDELAARDLVLTVHSHALVSVRLSSLRIGSA